MMKKHKEVLKALHAYDGERPHRFTAKAEYKKETFDLYNWGYLDCRSAPRNGEDYICYGLTEKGLAALQSPWTLDRRLVLIGIILTAIISIASLAVTLYLSR